MPLQIAIIGLGIAGPTLALQLQRLGHSPTIYELRSSPSTLGGAINLTPPGIRILESLGIDLSPISHPVERIELFSYASGARLGEVAFGSRPDGCAVRIMRGELNRALVGRLEAVGVKVEFGRKVVGVEEREEGVRVLFEDGKEVEAGLVIGCDGIHSLTRTLCVDPDRRPIYTGVAAAMATVPVASLKEEAFFDSTGLLMGQKGSFIISFVDQEKKQMYAAAVMSMAEQKDKEGWRGQGKDKDATKKEILRRYEGGAMPYVSEYVRKIENVFFYPIFKLAGQGKWSKGRVLCLGDAAHAMPPQGESMTLAIEDAALFARVLETFPDKPVEEIIAVYERTRRPGIDAAYDEAVQRWENVKDTSWLANIFREWMTWAFLWAMSGRMKAKWDFDIRTIPLVV
ncbi:MAG: hypothetical protein M1814_006096 [Vezdaea aestivalis]|nr:MAG: hypothetical protein M1814_006096 [Vezdaea aestivalis]